MGEFDSSIQNEVMPINSEHFRSKAVFRGCHRQPLYCFHFDFRYVTLDIYIYIIFVPTRNRNNEFILQFILREIKMADFECRQLEFGLEFVR